MPDAKGKTVTLGQILSEADVRRAARLMPDVDAIEREIIAPQIDAINQRLEQENHPRYLAYAVYYALSLNAGVSDDA